MQQNDLLELEFVRGIYRLMFRVTQTGPDQGDYNPYVTPVVCAFRLRSGSGAAKFKIKSTCVFTLAACAERLRSVAL